MTHNARFISLSFHHRLDKFRRKWYRSWLRLTPPLLAVAMIAVTAITMPIAFLPPALLHASRGRKPAGRRRLACLPHARLYRYDDSSAAHFKII